MSHCSLSLWALVTWNPTGFDPCEPTKVDILCPSIIRPLCEDMSVIRGQPVAPRQDLGG